MKRLHFAYIIIMACFTLVLVSPAQGQTVPAEGDSLLQDSTNKFNHETQSNRNQANEAVEGSGNAESIREDLREQTKEARQEAKAQKQKARAARQAERASRQASKAEKQRVRAEKQRERAEKDAAKAQERAAKAKEKADRQIEKYYDNNQP